jgi:hypothetical protein
MDLGTYDIPILVTLVHDFIPILESRGYEHTYLEFHEGHSWGNWRGHLDNALEMFFPGPALSTPEGPRIPTAFGLLQNYPNPFNPKTTISYSVPPGGTRSRPDGSRDGQLSADGWVVLKVYNVLGQLVATLVDEPQTAGYKSVVWDGRNESGASVASGIYIYRMSVGSFTATKRMLLLK